MEDQTKLVEQLNINRKMTHSTAGEGTWSVIKRVSADK